MIKGIDVSNWQTIDFNALDVDFIIMKSTEGVGFTDPKFYSFQKSARDKGILIGYYHFVRPDLGNTAEAEADYFIKICSPKQGEVLCLDFEVTYSNKVVWCKAFLDRVFEITGCKPIIYLNKSLVSGNNWSSVIDGGYGLWLADYSYNPDSICPDTPWSVVAFRQYSNKAIVSGISGVVDANVFYGDSEAFKKYGIDFSPPSATSLTELDEMRLSRDRWKKDFKDLEALHMTLKTDYAKAQADLEQALRTIEILKEAIQTNKTPLSFYTWTERFKSLFS